MNTSPNAILLLGPTGSGKTPFGAYLEGQGLNGRRCHHFDFGENLRRAAKGGFGGGLVAAEVTFIQGVLQDGRLLEDETFYIAAHLFDAFLDDRRVGTEDLVVLNGLPRHVGQAQAMEPFVAIRTVVELSCAESVVLARLRANAGGDRTDRSDDARDLVLAKLETYEARTRPLLDFFRRRARVVALDVGVDTQPPELQARLERGIA